MVDQFSEEVKKARNDNKNELNMMIAEYKKGLNGDEEYLEKYEEIGKTIEPKIQKRLINHIKRGLTLENVLNQEDIPIDHDILKKWYAEGEKGNDKYRMFNIKISHELEEQNKENILNHLKNGLALEDAVNEKDVLTTLYEVNKWYKLGYRGNKRHLEFYNLSQPFLNDSIIIKEKIVLNEKPLTKTNPQNKPKTQPLTKTNKTNPQNKPKTIPCSLMNKMKETALNNTQNSKKLLEPENNAAENFIGYLKQGLSIEESLEQNDVNWDFNELKANYLNSKNGSLYRDTLFYMNAKHYLLNESRKNIVEYLQNGLKIGSILGKENVFHDYNNLKNDYNKGFYSKQSFDEEKDYREFYEIISPLLMKQNKENIIKYLKLKKNLKDVFLMHDVITNEDEFKLWYENGKCNDSAHEKFFHETFEILKKDYINNLIKTVKEGKNLKDQSYLKDYFNLNDIEKWFIETKDNNSNIHYLHQIKIQEEVIEKMQETSDSLSDVLKKYEFYYSADKILHWYKLGSKGKKPYHLFYKNIGKILEQRKIQKTKNEVIRLVKETGDFNEVLRTHSFDYDAAEIKIWYQTGKYEAEHRKFRIIIDSLIDNNKKGLTMNPGGKVKINR